MQSYNLVLANTWFGKCNIHLATFQSEANVNTIKLLLERFKDRRSCIYYKVILREIQAILYRILVLDVCVKQV